MHVRLAIIAALIIAAVGTAAPAAAACQPYPVTEHSPTGIVGCEVYGVGIASHWQGPGDARNDCVWPWDACTPIKVTSLDTGRSIVTTPTMYCDCYTGTARERLVDLSPASLQALGLDPARGLYTVRVVPAPAAATLPDTTIGQREWIGLGALLMVAGALVIAAADIRRRRTR